MSGFRLRLRLVYYGTSWCRPENTRLRSEGLEASGAGASDHYPQVHTLLHSKVFLQSKKTKKEIPRRTCGWKKGAKFYNRQKLTGKGFYWTRIHHATEVQRQQTRTFCKFSSRMDQVCLVSLYILLWLAMSKMPIASAHSDEILVKLTRNPSADSCFSNNLRMSGWSKIKQSSIFIGRWLSPLHFFLRFLSCSCSCSSSSSSSPSSSSSSSSLSLSPSLHLCNQHVGCSAQLYSVLRLLFYSLCVTIWGRSLSFLLKVPNTCCTH